MQVGQPLGESARMVSNVHEAVRFPLHVVELGDDIAGDCRLPAQRLDLALERRDIEAPAPRSTKPSRSPKMGASSRVAKARLEPMRIGGAEVPVVPAFEPPWLASVRLQDLARMGQPPDPELRADQRLVAAPLCIAMRGEGPGRAACEGARRRCKSLVLMGEAIIPMEVLDVGLEVVVAWKAGGIVDKQAVGNERLRLSRRSRSASADRPDCRRDRCPIPR